MKEFYCVGTSTRKVCMASAEGLSASHLSLSNIVMSPGWLRGERGKGNKKEKRGCENREHQAEFMHRRLS